MRGGAGVPETTRSSFPVNLHPRIMATYQLLLEFSTEPRWEPGAQIRYQLYNSLGGN